MSSNARRCPVGRGDGIDLRVALFDDAAHKFVHQVGMRPVVPAALLEGEVFFIFAVHKPGGIASNGKRQPAGGSGGIGCAVVTLRPIPDT